MTTIQRVMDIIAQLEAASQDDSGGWSSGAMAVKLGTLHGIIRGLKIVSDVYLAKYEEEQRQERVKVADWALAVAADPSLLHRCPSEVAEALCRDPARAKRLGIWSDPVEAVANDDNFQWTPAGAEVAPHECTEMGGED